MLAQRNEFLLNQRMSMKILNFDVEGFRSLKNISNWQPKNLNVLIGPNGSGKSNLLRALDLLAASAQGRLAKLVQSSGGIEPLIWDGEEDVIRFKVKCSPTDHRRNENEDSLTYELLLERVGKGGEYRIGNEVLANYRKVEQGIAPKPFKFLERHGLQAKIFDEKQHSLAAPEENVPALETLLSLAADPFTQNRLIPPFRSQMSGWSVYHDFHTNRDAVVRAPAVTRHEKRVQPDGQNLISVLHTLYTGEREFKREINAAMRAAFGEDFEELVFAPASDQRIQLRIRWKSLAHEQSAADLSDGTLRFLFLLTVLSSPDPAPLIAIDEPETGLHPSMLPIVAEYAADAARRAQVILTTHSPQFLDAFGKNVPMTTVVKWKDGKTDLKTITGEELKDWLDEYSLGELHKSGELEAMAT
jgi:predicted ATPase